MNNSFLETFVFHTEMVVRSKYARQTVDENTFFVPKQLNTTT